MSLNYDLRISTELGAAEVLALLGEQKSGFQPSSTPEKLAGIGLTVSVKKEREPGRTIIRESYGIDPRIRVNFNLDKFGDFGRGLETAVKAALNLMNRTDSDGVLLFEHDTPVLMIKSGRLVLDPGPGFWPDLPALINRSFDFEELPLPK